MPYAIRNYNKQIILNLLDGLVNTTATSISLIGKNVENFGLLQNENFVWLLENFAGSTAPENPLPGQIWFKSDDRQAYVYDGQEFKLLGPEKAGDFATTALRSATIIDSTSQQRPVIQIIVNNEVLAILSSTQFVLNQESTIPGFTTIYRGITFKNYLVNNSDVMVYGNSSLATTATNAINAVTKIYSDKTTSIATTAFVHSVLPLGSIILWAGNAGNIPQGWVLCDGTNNTPDLRDRFVLGASFELSPRTTGGQTNINITTNTAGVHNHTSKTGGTVLTASQIPPHAHILPIEQQQTGVFTQPVLLSRNSDKALSNEVLSGETGGGQPHDHDLQADGTHFHTANSVSIMPPWYSLCYIMKIV
jgi:hypothetical protein